MSANSQKIDEWAGAKALVLDFAPVSSKSWEDLERALVKELEKCAPEGVGSAAIARKLIVNLKLGLSAVPANTPCLHCVESCPVRGLVMPERVG